MEIVSTITFIIINEKTNYTSLARRDGMIHNEKNLEIEGHIFYGVPRFKCLGVFLMQNNGLKTETY